MSLGYITFWVLVLMLIHHVPYVGMIHNVPCAGMIHNVPCVGMIHNVPCVGMIHNVPCAGMIYNVPCVIMVHIMLGMTSSVLVLNSVFHVLYNTFCSLCQYDTLYRVLVRYNIVLRPM